MFSGRRRRSRGSISATAALQSVRTDSRTRTRLWARSREVSAVALRPARPISTDHRCVSLPGASVVESRSANPTTAVSTLLRSCASPPARRPTSSSFSACCRRSSSRRTSETSWRMPAARVGRSAWSRETTRPRTCRWRSRPAAAGTRWTRSRWSARPSRWPSNAARSAKRSSGCAHSAQAATEVGGLAPTGATAEGAPGGADGASISAARASRRRAPVATSRSQRPRLAADAASSRPSRATRTASSARSARWVWIALLTRSAIEAAKTWSADVQWRGPPTCSWQTTPTV